MLDQDDQDEESHLIPVIIMISNQILVGSSITSLESLSNVQISVLIFLLWVRRILSHENKEYNIHWNRNEDDYVYDLLPFTNS